MLLFRRLGLPASREAHTKLFVNNAYVGLYTIVESVDKTFLKRNFNEDDGYLFKYRVERSVLLRGPRFEARKLRPAPIQA